MTNQNDSFIDEVTEEVRRDRLFALMKRWGWIPALIVLAIVAGTAWTQWRAAQARTAAEAFGDSVVAALLSEDDGSRIALMQDIPAEGETLILRGLLTATEQQASGDLVGAAATLDAVATAPDVPAIYRDLASLKSQMIEVPGRSDTDRRAALESLARPGAPFALLASEQLALMDVAAGDTAEAIRRLTAIAENAEVSRGLRERAEALIVALGGAPGDAGPTPEEPAAGDATAAPQAD